MGDDFEVIQPLGDHLSRDEYLGEVDSGALDYLVLEPICEIEVRLYGDAAAMRYRGQVQVVLQGRNAIDQQLWPTGARCCRAGLVRLATIFNMSHCPRSSTTDRPR